jgi:integrase
VGQFNPRGVPLTPRVGQSAGHGAADRQSLCIPGKEPQSHRAHLPKNWEGFLIKASIENFRWHDLRHTFASRLVMAGVDLYTVSKLLGHHDIKMTQRYAHLSPDHLHQAVRVLDKSKRSDTRTDTQGVSEKRDVG